MNGRWNRRGSLRPLAMAACLLLWGLSARVAAAPPEPLKTSTIDAAHFVAPAGWTAIERRVFDAYAAAVSRGDVDQQPGFIERCRYQLTLHRDGTLSGEASGRITQPGPARFIVIGQPTFAIAEFEIDGKAAAWGTDSRGAVAVLCPSTGADFRCRLSQQGNRRGDSVEFPVAWLTSTATQLELTVPGDMSVEPTGLLKTAERRGAEGSLVLTFEAGARANSTIRCVPKTAGAFKPFGVELRQTVSASVSKVLIQADLDLLSQGSGPAMAEIPIPPGFTLARATVGGAGHERLVVENAGANSGVVRLPLGDLSAGQKFPLRLLLESPADWSKAVELPRITPQNGVLLGENWVLEIENPLELIDVDVVDFVQSSLSVEGAREVWTWQGAARDGKIAVKARVREPDWTADTYYRREEKGQRKEIRALIDLKSTRGPLYEFDVDLLKPWKIVSVTTRDSTGSTSPLSFTTVEEHDSTTRHRILLRSPASPQSNVAVLVVVASQLSEPPARLATVLNVALGHVGASYVVTPETGGAVLEGLAEFGPAAPFSSLRGTVRNSSLFDNLKADAATVRRLLPRVSGGKLAGANGAAPIGPRDIKAVAAPIASPVPLARATAVAELRTTVSAAADSSSHRALFVFEEPVDVSDAVIQFDSDWSLIDVRCDGASLKPLAQPRELRFPKHAAGVRELEIHYSTPSPPDGLMRRDSICWPQPGASILRWTWRIEASAERRVTELGAPAEFEGGIRRAALRERLLSPLGRPRDERIFNPLGASGWREFFGLSPAEAASSGGDATPLIVSGREYPVSTTVISWSWAGLTWLNWVIFLGSMLGVAVIRRMRRRTFRLAAVVAASAATAAWLSPGPFGSMAGAAFLGSLLAFFLPRRFLAPAPRPSVPHSRSSVIQLAGAVVVLVAVALGRPTGAAAVPSTDAPNALFVEDHEKLTTSVYVSEAVAREIAAWQRQQSGPESLIRSAHYDVQIESTDLAVAKLMFDVIVPKPAGARSIQLPFEGLTLRGPDAAVINGERAKLVPAADGSGVLLTLNPAGPVADGEPANFRIELDATLRVASIGSRREFSLMLPRCLAAVGTVKSRAGALNEFRSTASGGSTVDGQGEASCRLGGVSNWQVRWKPEGGMRSQSEARVTARAETVISTEPESFRATTRLVITSPETADPFASTRLEISLPKRAMVAAAVGESLAGWRTVDEQDALRVLLDLKSPAIVGQQFDVTYFLPVEGASPFTLPAIPLLAGQLDSHQIALVAPPTFNVEFLSRPDSDLGLWAIAPSEASFSLRKDRGEPAPAAALELEFAQPLVIGLSKRESERTAELEQSMIPATDAIAWSGSARIESSARPSFVYEFRVDPAIEIVSASVVERDVERLTRYFRDGERLILVVGDDRLGTKNVRLDGKLRLEASKVHPVPVFDLKGSVITRREVIVTSSLDQLLQVRRSEMGTLVANRAGMEWEPVVPSSLRVSPATGASSYQIRWINPASPLDLTQFLKLPEPGEATVQVDWLVESTQHLPSPMVIDAPADTQLVEPSDYVEEKRLPGAGDRVRLELQAKSGRLSVARLRMTIPASAAGGLEHLPHLAESSIHPVTYLAVQRSQLDRYEVPGDFVDALPAAAPAEWDGPAADRSLLVFKPGDRTWRVRDEAGGDPLAQAAAEIVASQSGGEVHGQTRWIITPSRVANIRVSPPANGKIHAVVSSSAESAAPTADGGWELLIRPSQPVAVICDWSAAATGLQETLLGDVGPQLAKTTVHIRYAAIVRSGSNAEWRPELLGRAAGMNLLAAVRLEDLLQVARQLPIGARPPDWLRDELADLAIAFRGAPQVDAIAAQAETMLDSWARLSTLKTVRSIAPDNAIRMHDTQRLLADSMFAAAADPDAKVVTPAAREWSLSPTVFNALFTTSWLIFWSFVITKGGACAREHELADRVARHPAAMLFLIGVAWWLLLAPGAVGVVMAVAAAVWGTAAFLKQRSTVQKSLPAGPSS